MRDRLSSSKYARPLACCMLVLMIIFIVSASRFFVDSLAFTRAETEVGFWGRGEYHPRESSIRDAIRTVDDVLASQPGHPDYLELSANAAAWLAYWAESIDSRAYYSQQAIVSQYSALRSRPAHRHSWAKMIEYSSRAPGNEALAEMAQQKLDALMANSIVRVDPK